MHFRQFETEKNKIFVMHFVLLLKTKAKRTSLDYFKLDSLQYCGSHNRLEVLQENRLESIVYHANQTRYQHLN